MRCFAPFRVCDFRASVRGAHGDRDNFWRWQEKATMPTSLPIAESVEQYVQSRVDATQSTRERHSYRLGKFIDYCTQEGITETSEIDGAVIEGFRTYRLSDEDTSIVTNEQCIHTFRVYLRYLERIEACEEGLSDKVLIPDVPDSEEARDVHISHERATQIIDYLAKYEWASVEHIVFHLCYHTGLRRGALHGLDVDDWQSGDRVLLVRNRKNTPLKLREKGERNLSITGDRLAAALDDYIEEVRPEVTDDDGREPLLASQQGRYHPLSLQKMFYKVTRPCFFADQCPVGRAIEECDAAQVYEKRSTCPESVSVHPIRRSAITHHLDSDVPKTVVSERMNVDEKTLDKHYDARSREQKRKSREQYLDSV